MNCTPVSIFAVTSFALFATHVHAADPTLPPPLVSTAPAATPVDDWAGFYAGVNAGYGLGETYEPGGLLAIGAPTFDSVNGVFGGAQIGGNIQQDMFVFGLETDIQASGLTQTIADGNARDVITGIDYFGTVRARAGVDLEGVLPFVTGGLAYGQGYVDDTDAGNARNVLNHFGWTAGGGVEFKMSDDFSLKGEYLYTDLGSEQYSATLGGRDLGHRFHSVRVGANFHF